ncbi:response regulator [Deinococcus sp. MIMF12]|uniref:Response regulator n=1 Tax=Deinococcus rhizophilus TaxID=3049544 RepID=A0ABT7JE85_9DEIO|nr:response regulator [Deinococcus rhizophilus]MDL2343365.1 response regulator [Deinococcus rhizophilus]
MERRRILLVDDNPNDVELALNALQDREAEVEVAASGAEALAALHGRPLPDLILLDLNMPQMDGLAVLDQIRGAPATCRIPVVILSTSGEERDVADCYAHGATAYVVKPMDFGQFRCALRTITDFWARLNVRPRLR